MELFNLMTNLVILTLTLVLGKLKVSKSLRNTGTLVQKYFNKNMNPFDSIIYSIRVAEVAKRCQLLFDELFDDDPNKTLTNLESFVNYMSQLRV